MDSRDVQSVMLSQDHMGVQAAITLAELMRAQTVSLFLLEHPGDEHGPCVEHRATLGVTGAEYVRVRHPHLSEEPLLELERKEGVQAQEWTRETGLLRLEVPLRSPRSGVLYGQLVVDRPPDAPIQQWEARAVRRLGARLAALLDQAYAREVEGIPRQKVLFEVEEEAARAVATSAWEAIGLLGEVSALLSSSRDFQQTLQDVARLVTRELADWCTVILVENDGTLRRVAAEHRDQGKRESMQRLMSAWSLARYGHDIVMEVVKSGEPRLLRRITTEDIASWKLTPEYAELLLTLGTCSIMYVPLQAQSGVMGVLTLVSSTQERLYDHNDVSLAMALADRCALAIEQSRLYQAAQEAVVERDRFIAVASHELRTPMTHILGYARLLERSLRLGEKVVQEHLSHVERLIKSTEHLARLVSNLLDVSLLKQGKMRLDCEFVDLVALVREIAEEFEQHLPPAYVLETAGLVGSVLVWTDALRVQQVVENLLENARKYSPDGGVIRLAVRQEDGGVVIEVQDHGRGIVSEALERIFAPFERGGQPGQGEPHIEGMGLGLYVSRSVMSALGGRIWATHGEEGGSIFSIWLPQEKKPDM